MRFQLTITLGNDAMQTGRDIGRALAKAASRVMEVAPLVTEPIEEGESGLVKDDNGNIVGKWEVVS